MSSLNASIARIDLVARPGTSWGRASAAAKLIFCRVAKAATYSCARSPMPRLGTFSTRRSDTSSPGLAISRR